MTTKPTPLEGEDELRTFVNKWLVDVAFGINDREDLPRLADTLLKEFSAIVSTKEREARIDENIKWKEVAEEIVEKDGVYRAVNHLNQRLAHLNAKEKDV